MRYITTRIYFLIKIIIYLNKKYYFVGYYNKSLIYKYFWLVLFLDFNFLIKYLIFTPILLALNISFLK